VPAPQPHIRPVPGHFRPAPPQACRQPRRPLLRAAAAALAAVAVLAVGGCAKFDATFGQQEAVVQFQPGTSLATRLQVRAACSHISQVTPEKLPTDQLASDQLYDVRYQIGGASDAQIARLQVCLQKFRSVVGINFSTPGGN
jgi:hypothetical protein